MNILNDPFPPLDAPFVASIGKFDGVHAGHRLILDTLLHEAQRHVAVSVAYCFGPRNGTPLLTTKEEKQDLLASMGIHSMVDVEFTGCLMDLPAERFVEELTKCGTLMAVAVGRDFRFGRGAAGDVPLLEQLGRRHGFEVHALPQMEIGGQPVSSTFIRQCVKSGDVELAAKLLGREYALSGVVVQGRRLGRQLGFHTANILPPPGKVMPAIGVYACLVDAGGKAWPAMTNIGYKPTVDGGELLIESHLIGFEGDLYGKQITVRLVKKIRDEAKFQNTDQLAKQLERDKNITVEALRGII